MAKQKYAKLDSGIWPVEETDVEKIDPKSLYIPRTPEEEKEAMAKRNGPWKPPFGSDETNQGNVQPSQVKGSPWKRDRSKDGERELDIMDKEYMNKEAKTDLLKEGERHFDPTTAANEYDNYYLVPKGSEDRYPIGAIVTRDGKEWVVTGYDKHEPDNLGLYLKLKSKLKEQILLKESTEAVHEIVARSVDYCKMLSQSGKVRYACLQVGDTFTRNGIEYTGIYAVDADGDSKEIRFDYSKGNLTSISIWVNMGSEFPGFVYPTTDADLMNNPIVVAQAIESADTKPWAEVKEFEEAVSHFKESKEDEVNDFFADEKGSLTPGMSMSKMHQRYMQWAMKRSLAPMSYAIFAKYLVPLLGGVAKPTSIGAEGRAVEVAPKEEIPPDPDFDNLIDASIRNEVLDTFEQMEEITKLIAKKDPKYKNMFVYGTGGVGKTSTVRQALKKYANPDDLVIKRGAIEGFRGLLQLLWENRDDKIILLDDNDGLVDGSNRNALNILKVAMDLDEPRIISYTRFRRGGATKETFKAFDPLDPIAMLREASDDEDDIEENDYENEGEGTTLSPEHDPAYGMGPEDIMLEDFQFNSRIIFISNLSRVPQPLMDRCVLVELLLTKAQILDRIEQLLGTLMKEYDSVTMEIKKESLKFFRRAVLAEKRGTMKIGRPLTFRTFITVTGFLMNSRTGDIKNWERKAIKLLKSGKEGPLK